MASVRTPDPNPGWLSDIALDETRSRVPILYVEGIPVRVDATGNVEHVGLLLRGSPTTGAMNHTFVSGRVMHGESVRDALLRNLEKDLGPTAFPQLPTSIVPVSVAEYLPLPGVTPLHDPRQHAVALVYVVPVTGECNPRQEENKNNGGHNTEPEKCNTSNKKNTANESQHRLNANPSNNNVQSVLVFPCE